MIHRDRVFSVAEVLVEGKNRRHQCLTTALSLN
jgi:hypothetical protein